MHRFRSKSSLKKEFCNLSKPEFPVDVGNLRQHSAPSVAIIPLQRREVFMSTSSSVGQRVCCSDPSRLFSCHLSGNKLEQYYGNLHQESKQTNKLPLQSTTETNTKSENKLEGTKLADFTPVEKVDSLQKIDTKVGCRRRVKAGDTVTAHYTGAKCGNWYYFFRVHTMVLVANSIWP